MTRRHAAAALLAVLALGPMAWVALEALRALWPGQGWAALLADPRTPHAWGLGVATGVLSTALAWGLTAALLGQALRQRALQGLWRPLPWMLATPHAAAAIGLLLLLAPTGWLWRALSPWLTGWQVPPSWAFTQDPWGLSLVLALVLKEVPFLLWMAAAQWQREDVRRRWQAEWAVAMALGYSPAQAYWRVLWPQLAWRLRWPLLAVLAYGLGTVDMALVIGPASPPTLGVLAWEWLQDADPLWQAQGAAAAGALAVTTVLAMALCWRWLRWRAFGPHLSRGHRGQPPLDGSARHARFTGTAVLTAALTAAYGGLWAALVLGSVAGVWVFPAFWPEQFTPQAWAQVWASRGTVGQTLGLAVAASAAALCWSVAWLEWAPAAWDRRVRPCVYAALLWPAVLWVMGLYGVALRLHGEGHWWALWAAHVLMALPYVLLSLAPAYQAFDVRYAQLSASLGQGRWRFWWRVKAPLLRPALAASAAVGVAVSVAQYLPTLYVGAGRWSTVTTEAVGLAAGGQRQLAAAYAVLQAAVPMLAFAAAAWLGRPRRFGGAA